MERCFLWIVSSGTSPTPSMALILSRMGIAPLKSPIPKPRAGASEGITRSKTTGRRCIRGLNFSPTRRKRPLPLLKSPSRVLGALLLRAFEIWRCIAGISWIKRRAGNMRHLIFPMTIWCGIIETTSIVSIITIRARLSFPPPSQTPLLNTASTSRGGTSSSPTTRT